MIDSEGLKTRIRKMVAVGVNSPFLRNVGPASRTVKLADCANLDSITYTPLVTGEPVLRHYPDFYVETSEHIFPRIDRHGLETRTYDAGVVSMRGGRVNMPQSVSSVDGRFIREVYLHGLRRPKEVLAAQMNWLPPTRHRGEALLLSLTGVGNFYHWTTEILPRLLLTETDSRWNRLPVLIPRSAPGFVRRSTELAIGSQRIVELPDGLHSFDVLHVPTILAKSEQIAPVAVKWLHDTFIKDRATAPERRLYVSRRDAPTRYVENESEIERILADYGFESVSLSGRPFEEQAELFRSASIVVGSHGAGFANVAFCRPGTTLIELFSPAFVSICYWSLCNACGHKYGYTMNEDSGRGLRVDALKLSRVLDQALTAPAP